MRKIETLFITISLAALIYVTGAEIWHKTQNINTSQNTQQMPETNFGTFLAAQHAIYVNDFDNATKFAQKLTDTHLPIVENIVLISDFLNGQMPLNADLLKDEKSMPARLIYDAYLIRNEKWPEIHNRHKTDESALGAPLRIWPAIANDWRTNTFKFIDKLPTNESWKSFVRGQIYAELKQPDVAATHFAQVSTDFINVNDYMYIMSFYTHHDMPDAANALRQDFTSRPGGMFLANYDNIPDWSVYSGYKNALAFGLVQSVSHTQIMMYSDMAMLMLRFAEIIAPEYARTENIIDYYLGQYLYNNTGDYIEYFSKIKPSSPLYPFAQLRIAERDNDIDKINNVLKKYPLFVPGINKLVGYHIQNGNKRAALRAINRALKQDNLDETGRAFFIKSRAYIYYVFGDYHAAQADLKDASDILLMDGEIMSLQAKIWAMQNREIENAYNYAMDLITQDPTDIMAWNTLGMVVAVREGADAALDMLERVGAVSETHSALFVTLGDLYATKGEFDMARDAYLRAIKLSDDGLIVVPEVERKIRKLK